MVVRLTFYYSAGSIELFCKDESYHLMRESHT